MAILPQFGDPQVWVNNNIYLVHIATDITLMAFILFRAPLTRKLYERLGKATKHIHLTNADVGLIAIVMAFLVVDLTAAIENLVRNLEHLGFSEDFAKQFWDYNWVFYHFADMKRILLGLEFLAIWSYTTKVAQKKFSISA
ncbi:hypothetical protein P2G88_01920 [Aliiglaciecola sp. CAU 1673]|uniref:hypothetical protein n=1 Tax=Aliiglaciecola sp. CAU 1673 TaxID=3032595 RepID=UPI0023DAC481|nr:hypothetical protein [Aliiglaciecola sp. CAU 1673]MDF2177010.1 hypothetical protein [Aliiglaciecola sp. CAU 1673]